MVKHLRLGSVICAFLVLSSLGLLCACKGPASDPKAELVSSLKGADVEGFLFALREGEDKTTSSLTDKATQDLITLGEGDSNLVLSYASVQDKKTNSTTTYKAEAIRKGDAVRIAVTDLATNRLVDDVIFPTPDPACGPPGPFDSIAACLQDFDCTRRGAIQCEANRTCKAQIAALTCCLKNGTIVSVHLIIKPTKILCLRDDLTPDLEGLVLSQN